MSSHKSELYYCDICGTEIEVKKSNGYKKRLIITDGVFSMDGDIAPLPDIVFLAKKYSALTMVDDAHATGVFGKKEKEQQNILIFLPMKSIFRWELLEKL